MSWHGGGLGVYRTTAVIRPPGPSIAAVPITPSAGVTVEVGVQSVSAVQPAVTTIQGVVEDAAVLSVQAVQPAVTTTQGVTQDVAVQSVAVVQPAVTTIQGVVEDAAALAVPVVQNPVTVVTTGSETVDVATLSVAADQQSATATGGAITAVAALDVPVVQNPAVVDLGTTVSVAVQSVAADQQTVTTLYDYVEGVLEQTVQVVLPAITVLTTTPGALLQPVKPQVLIAEQQPIVTVLPSDEVGWFYDGTRWLSVQTFQVIASFSNTSPYTGDEYARFGDVVSDANTGFVFRKPGRWVALSAQSDIGIGTVPSSSCDVELYVGGVLKFTASWDGSNYDFHFTESFDFDAGDRCTMKYIDDGVGQSAGKVVLTGEWRWRRA